MKVSILGLGSWGIALAKVLRMNKHEITMWSPKQEEVDKITIIRVKDNVFDNVFLDRDINLTCNIEEAVINQDIIVFAVPSNAVRDVAQKISNFYVEGQIIVVASKGIEEKTLLNLSSVIAEEVDVKNNICVLAGPSHAEEVVRYIPTNVVIASEDISVAQKCKEAFATKYFRIELSSDIIGTELCSSIKNIIAFCSGMIVGVGYGINTQAAFIVKSLEQLRTITTVSSIKMDTIYGLQGLGDIIVTSTSKYSRNMTAGMLVGQGKTLEEAKNEIGMVVETANSIIGVYELVKKMGIKIPLVDSLYEFLIDNKNNISAKQSIDKMLNIV